MATICSVEGCEKHIAKRATGLCHSHNERLKRNGNPLTVIKLSPGTPIKDRIAYYSRANGECLEWTGHLTPDGYGRIEVTLSPGVAIPVNAHRAAYEAEYGPCPPNMVVRHKCDNRKCVKLAHLEIGTQKQNIADKYERGRGLLGEKVPTAKLKEADILEIRRLAAMGLTNKSIAERYGVDRTNVSCIVLRKTWKHIADHPQGA